MRFERILAIDWSGAKYPRFNRKIQVAEYDPANHTVMLLHPLHGGPESPWSRTTVLITCNTLSKKGQS